MEKFIKIREANVHNLKNLSVDLPKDKLVVLTGVSGSGKSSLAFDTLYAEGQRRYVESLSSYARQFLGLMEKPDVKSIEGLSPAISIDQKTSSTNPRSTVGTVTEIYDYLRLLYGQVGETHCPNCGAEVKSQSLEEIANEVLHRLRNKDFTEGASQINHSDNKTRIQVLAPVIQGRKGTYNDLFENLLAKGFLRVRVDGDVYSLDEIDNIELDKQKKHNIDLIVDRLIAPSLKPEDTDTEEFKAFEKRLKDALEIATNMANGEVRVDTDGQEEFFSEKNTCPVCKISFPQIKPASFSFNSPYGACVECHGLGFIKDIDVDKIYNPKLSILEGGIFPWSNRTTSSESWTAKILHELAKVHNIDLKAPIGEFTNEIFDLIFYGKGANEMYRITYRNKQGRYREYDAPYEGVVPEIIRRYNETTSSYVRMETEKFMIEKVCSSCEGKRLQPYSLAVTINDKNINDIANMQIGQLMELMKDLGFNGNKAAISEPISREIRSRLQFLHDVGLTYLTLNRRANTLSGGESQRIRLASQIGTGLTGVLYVLDEPSIGLHSRDVSRLLNTLENLRELGNTVVVVEHDQDTIKHADYIVDIGPGAGDMGGEVVAQGDYDSFITQGSLTAKYLTGELRVGADLDDRPGKTDDSTQEHLPELIDEDEQDSHVSARGYSLSLHGVKTHNLKDVDVNIPLGKFVAITGVSGSGKSSLINDTLYPILMNEKMNGKRQVGVYDSISGLELVDKVIGIDQSPIGRTPRSNPITYTGAFTKIRELFAATPEARARGYKSGRFSFNVKGGRCEKCKGDGQIKIEMQFLPDMYVTCEECGGKRYNKEALQIDYKGLNISQVLDLRVSEALEFFKNISGVRGKLQLLEDVGLGYIQLGQYATTLSGGESQRIKLAKELSKLLTGHTVYILDEPTTGLHFHDVDKLLKVLKKLVEKNNTIIVIEHNMDIVRYADWIIDLGPEGGDQGGEIIAEGTVEDIRNNPRSHTGKFL